MLPARRHIPTREQLGRYSVNRPGWEVIRSSLYDFAEYPTSGVSFLNFFHAPVGTGGKTPSDTNMTLAGQLPAHQEFLVQSIEVLIFPNTPAVGMGSISHHPAVFGGQGPSHHVNDVYFIGRRGNLSMIIGSKPYLQEAPIGRFPPKTSFTLQAALSDQTTPGANMHSRIAYAGWSGRPFFLTPADLLLTSNQNFSVTLSWPEGVQPVVSAARVGVVLDGLLYRRSQ